jgi:hypothetical protein
MSSSSIFATIMASPRSWVETGSDLYPTVNALGPESVLTFTGKVAARSPETLNPKLATGRDRNLPERGDRAVGCRSPAAAGIR